MTTPCVYVECNSIAGIYPKQLATPQPVLMLELTMSSEQRAKAVAFLLEDLTDDEAADLLREACGELLAKMGVAA